MLIEPSDRLVVHNAGPMAGIMQPQQSWRHGALLWDTHYFSRLDGADMRGRFSLGHSRVHPCAFHGAKQISVPLINIKSFGGPLS
jgi:hypothetical protein